MSEHTPLPWRTDTFLVTASNGRQVTHTGLLGRRRSSHEGQSGGDEDEANAEYIERACNAYPGLLDENERLSKAYDNVVRDSATKRLEEARKHAEAIDIIGVVCDEVSAKNKAVVAEVAALRAALELVTDMVDDILYDPHWSPRNGHGEQIRGDDLYLLDHPVQESHVPALRQWFVEQLARREALATESEVDP